MKKNYLGSAENGVKLDIDTIPITRAGCHCGL